MSAVLAVADAELDRQLPPCDLVERVSQHRHVLRILRLRSLERRTRRERDRQRVPVELSRSSVTEEARRRDRLLRDGGDDRPRPRLLELLEVDVGRRSDRHWDLYGQWLLRTSPGAWH